MTLVQDVDPFLNLCPEYRLISLVILWMPSFGHVINSHGWEVPFNLHHYPTCVQLRKWLLFYRSVQHLTDTLTVLPPYSSKIDRFKCSILNRTIHHLNRLFIMNQDNHVYIRYNYIAFIVDLEIFRQNKALDWI